QIVDANIESIHSAYKSGQLTCRQLVQTYIDRIETLDKAGPAINSRIAVSSTALAEADRLDDAYRSIPVILKAPIDARGMATTLGSFLYKCWGRTIHGQPTKTSGIPLVSPRPLGY
ncbi:MAG: hypothetical protein ACXWZE_19020, partial [Candidatus Binatia bacterium]